MHVGNGVSQSCKQQQYHIFVMQVSLPDLTKYGICNVIHVIHSYSGPLKRGGCLSHNQNNAIAKRNKIMNNILCQKF